MPPVQVLALVFTFGAGHPGVQALAFTLLAILYTVAHTLVRPLRNPDSQALQTTLLCCLTAVALSGTPFGEAMEGGAGSGSGSHEATPSRGFGDALRLWCGVVVPAVAVAAAFRGLVWRWVVLWPLRKLGLCRPTVL